MRFQLPQFIETETKLIGPFTLKQFMWIAAGGALLVIVYMVTKSFLIMGFLGIPIGGVFVSLAFIKINDMPLINYVSSALSYAINPKKYIYRNDKNDQSLSDQYITYQIK